MKADESFQMHITLDETTALYISEALQSINFLIVFLQRKLESRTIGSRCPVVWTQFSVISHKGQQAELILREVWKVFEVRLLLFQCVYVDLIV